MKGIWEFFDGKKTNIGSTLLLAGFVLSKLAGIWEFEETWVPNAVETLNWVGAFLGGTGLGHKGIKAVKK